MSQVSALKITSEIVKNEYELAHLEFLYGKLLIYWYALISVNIFLQEDFLLFNFQLPLTYRMSPQSCLEISYPRATCFLISALPKMGPKIPRHCPQQRDIWCQKMVSTPLVSVRPPTSVQNFIGKYSTQLSRNIGEYTPKWALKNISKMSPEEVVKVWKKLRWCHSE